MTASLAGRTVTHARLWLSAWGIPWAEAATDDEVELAGAVELTIADLTLACTVVSGGPAKGRSHFRLVGGAGGWGRAIAAAGYANDAGVKVATVLRDAAAACGETFDASTASGTVGPAYAREKGPASRALQLFAPEAWYVGEDGTTRLGRRPSAPLAVTAQVGPVDRARARLTLASESIATVVPGVVVDGVEAVDVLHEVTPNGLRSTIWGAVGANDNDLASALRRQVAALFPDLAYRGVFEFRVVTAEGERLNLQPVRVSTGLPELRRVNVRPGVAGARADVALGSRVLVTFIDADPARPAVIAFEDADGAGFVPTGADLNSTGTMTLGEDAARVVVAGGSDATVLTGAQAVGRVVRYGDAIFLPAPISAPYVLIASDNPANPPSAGVSKVSA